MIGTLGYPRQTMQKSEWEGDSSSNAGLKNSSARHVQLSVLECPLVAESSRSLTVNMQAAAYLGDMN
jgi:hypothetical protein